MTKPIERLNECKTLVKLVALGDAKAAVDCCKRIDDAATYMAQLETSFKEAIECCSAFQAGGQFNHLMRPGESIFQGVPRLVAQLSN